MTSGHERCWFCGQTRLPLTDEHVLSKHHFGARLVAPKTVCSGCNSASGEIENLVAGGPFVSEAVAEFRTGSVPRARAYPGVRGRTSDGATVHVEERRGQRKIVALTPRQIRSDDDGTPVWEVEAGTEADFEARQLEKGNRVRAEGRALDSLQLTETQKGIGDKTIDAWPRFVAKVVLATGSLVLPESWLDSTDAGHLRAHFLRLPSSIPRPFQPLEQDRGEEPWSLFDGAHGLLFRRSPNGDGAQFVLALFGYLGAEIELPETTCPPDEPGWIVPSDFGMPIQEPGAELDQALRERASRARRPGR